MGDEERIKQLEAEVERLKSFHRADCNSILDDESDQVLTDYQACTCISWAKEIADLRRERDEALARETAQSGLISSLQQERKDWWIEKDELLAQMEGHRKGGAAP